MLQPPPHAPQRAKRSRMSPSLAGCGCSTLTATAASSAGHSRARHAHPALTNLGIETIFADHGGITGARPISGVAVASGVFQAGAPLPRDTHARADSSSNLSFVHPISVRAASAALRGRRSPLSLQGEGWVRSRTPGPTDSIEFRRKSSLKAPLIEPQHNARTQRCCTALRPLF